MIDISIFHGVGKIFFPVLRNFCVIFALFLGLLGGIGRRVSSFIWGGTQSGTSGTEAKLVQGENFNHFVTILVILTIF